jgi:glycosyltransferase involved in cell wall biosynthesis
MIKLGTDPDKIHFIYHGVDTQRFRPVHKNEALQKTLGVSGSPVIISIRSLSPIYNVETVVKSAPAVLRQFPGAVFIIAGEGSQKEYLEDMARSLGVLEHSKFIGLIPHEELPQYLALADVYVSTSLSDGGISVSLMEAMSCGLAPVVTDSGDNRLWIENGKNGYVIPVKNPEILAEKIVHLLRNQGLRETMGKINRQLVEQKANYEKEMDKMEKLYEEVVRRN